MQDTELYRHLLGLESPWEVERIELSVKEGEVKVWVGHGRGTRWPCPSCQRELATYDHAAERRWRHLDSCQFLTYLLARPPRVECPEHGVQQVRLPWAEPMARFTHLFERLAIDVLRECSVAGGSEILRLSWDEAWHLMERAVVRGQANKPVRELPYLGLDEKSAGRGQDYVTIVTDLVRGTVEHVADERRTNSLNAYWASLSNEIKTGVQAVAMDMWEPYAESVRTHIPDAKIVYDRFHIMGYLGKAVDTVRKAEHRELLKDGDRTLAGSKYLWLYSEENLPKKHRRRFAELRDSNLRTGRAWAIKESLRALWHYRSRTWGKKFWSQWFFWATHSRLAPVVEAARTVQRHLHGVLNYFDHGITNASSEGMNSRIQRIRQMACGYRNRRNFKTAIYFHLGGLDLYPVTH